MVSSCSLVSRVCLANDSLESSDFKFSIASETSLNFTESLVETIYFIIRFLGRFFAVSLSNELYNLVSSSLT